MRGKLALLLRNPDLCYPFPTFLEWGQILELREGFVKPGMRSTLLTLDNSRVQHIIAGQAPASVSVQPAQWGQGWSCSCWAQPRAQAAPESRICLADMFCARFGEVFLITLGRGL